MKKESIYIYNPYQAYFYMVECGLQPIDKPGYNKNTESIYFVFDRESSKPCFDKWCKKNEKWKDENLR